MAKVHILNVTVHNNPAPFFTPFQFEINFECLEELQDDLEFKIIYVGSAETVEFDQTLDQIVVDAVPKGQFKFMFQADPPDTSKIPADDAVGVTVVLITASYRDQEFVRVGYYVNNEYEDPEMREPPRTESNSADAEEKSEEEDEEDGEGDEELEELDDVDDEEESEEEEEEEEEDKEELEDKAGNQVEDEFFKIKDLDKFMVKGEEAEYGGGAKQGKKKKKTKNWMEEDSDEEEEEDLDEDEDNEDEEDDDEHLDLEDFDDEEEEEEGAVGDIMYKDFFEEADDQKVRKKGGSKKVQFKDEPDEPEVDDKNDDGNDEQGLSTHEKARLKMHAKIEEMEKANLEPSTWTMQGEVNASSRPKNSALEVDLDFEHNVRPAPVITEEVTASLEEMIKKRIIEGHFDDVEKPSPLQFKSPKEQKDLDESKSKKGLAELYEDDYAQKAGLASAPLSISDELKNEANTLFKRICLKLDALSHFHFAPKPVIEDMSIQANVPALAMEEIAPVAVSDAAMLAPEEIFEGKGDVKEEAELTQAERKRRRANKKRRYAGSHKERPAKMQKD